MCFPYKKSNWSLFLLYQVVSCFHPSYPFIFRPFLGGGDGKSLNRTLRSSEAVAASSLTPGVLATPAAPGLMPMSTAQVVRGAGWFWWDLLTKIDIF